MSNFVGCDCLRQYEETHDNNNKNTDNKSQPKISLISKKSTTEGDDVNLTYVKSSTINSQFFDGKIDVKDYIQQLGKDSLDNYEKISLLGKGSYSSVYKVRNKNTNLFRAMKVIQKNFQKDNDEILREINILKNMDHPNVMKIYGFLEDEKNYYLIQEFCDEGDLETALENKKIYCEFLVRFIMYQVFLAINYLHSNNIVHQDIKKRNISIIKLGGEKENENKKLIKTKKSDSLKRLNSEKILYFNPLKKEDDIFIKINENKEIQEEFTTKKLIKNLSKKAKEYLYELSRRSIKVIDFGEAIFMPQKKKYIDDIAGTLNYLSPELIKGQMIKELDEWACGVLMYYLLSGKFPFDGKTQEEIFDNIENQELNLDIPELKNISDECKDLISLLLERDVNKRIKAKDALGHNFFKIGIKMKKIIGGMENKQAEKLLNSWIKLQESNKQTNSGMFRKSVLAYMALNFVEKEEEQKMKNLFYKLSGGNKNYLITKENFAKTIKQVSNNYTDEEINDLFNKLDENKNGIIEYEELVRGLSDKEKLLNEKNMKQAFNFFDQDKNGTITWPEISNVIFKNKKMTNVFKNQVLKEIQEDGKEVNINFDDFCKIIKK